MSYISIPSYIASVPADRTALIQGERSLTYGELNQRADRLAAHLLERGLPAQGVVAVALERSPEWVIAALAILRAGGVYLPLDLAWPDERLNLVLRDASVTHLIAAPCVMRRLDTAACLVDLQSEAEAIAATQPLPAPRIAPQSLAYLIYTSGSTGTPKGVEITHANLSHLVAWHHTCFQVTGADRASHLAGLSFDAAGWELWPSLAAGATVVMVPEMERTSPELLQRWMLAQRISIAFVPTVLAPALCSLTWPADTPLRYLLTGGDTLHRRPPAGLPFTLVNNYGPTECTVVATSGTVAAGPASAPSIGAPIQGASLYLLDEHGASVAQGAAGEIYIGGGGVGRGYRNLPELTRRSFLLDPFSPLPNARMYRTGDRGRLGTDGQIEFCGRTDNQEKIRGHRIELDEIASLLNRHPGVQAALVVAVADDEHEKTLVAYVQPDGRASLTSVELQQSLAERLPAYMIPAVFASIPAFPLTVNGKLDRASLPPVDECVLLPALAGRTDLSPLEARLLAMVRELLGTSNIGVSDDFFLAGGHSLLGTQLVLRVRSAFAIELSLRHLFEAPTAERLAQTVERLLIAQLDEMTDEEAVRQMEVLA